MLRARVGQLLVVQVGLDWFGVGLGFKEKLKFYAGSGAKVRVG